MIELFESLARPFLHALDAETAHRATIVALRSAILPSARRDPQNLAVEAFGLRFPNPLGMAAGFDKNGEVVDPVLALGFGFIEVGTVTPRPQSGNPRPRVFRLPRSRGIVNRLGFNNDGHAVVHARLVARRDRGGIVGVNLGANKDSVDRAADYVAGIACFADVASYFTINVSSPNTPGLRDLQEREALDDLLARVVDARDAATAGHPRRPLLLKIAPDLTLAQLDDIVDVALSRGVEGLIVSNTTIAREGLPDHHATQAGGLSGRPVFERSTAILRETAARVGGRVPLVAVGGIDSPEAAREKLAAGATLLQLYSALVFEGIGLVGRIKRGLVSR